MCTGSISSNIYSCALILHANVLNRDLKHLSSKGPSCPCSRRESIWCGGSFAPQSLTLRGELHYPSNRRICVSESRSELFLFGGKENLLPRILGRTIRDLVTVPTDLFVCLSVRCLKQRILSNDKLIQILNFVQILIHSF